MAYPTAEQVQNAYSMNLYPAIQQIQGIGETAARNQLLAERRKKEQQAMQLQNLALMDDALNPLEKGTGYHPIDALQSQRLAEIRAKGNELNMAGADPATVYNYIRTASNGLRQEQTGVTRALQNNALAAKAIAENDATVDPVMLSNALNDSMFFTKDSKGNKVFNPNYDLNADVASPFRLGGDEALDPYRNPVLVQQAAAKELPLLYPKRRTPDIPSPVKGITQSAEVPPYLTIDPNLKQTVYDTQNITLKGVDGKPYSVPVFKDEIVQGLFNAPATSRYLRRQYRQLRKALPEENASDADLQRFVATQFIQTHGAKPGSGVDEDDSEYKRMRQEQQDAFNQNMRLRADARGAESLGLQKQRLEDAEKAQKTKNLNTPFGIATLGLTREKDPHTGASVPKNPDQFAQLHSFDEKVKLPGTKEFIGSNLNDFSGKTKEPLYVHGRPALVHLVDIAGNPMLTYQFLQRMTTKKEKNGGVYTDTQWVPTGEAQVIHADKFNDAWNTLAPQLGMNAGKYDAAYNEQPADPYSKIPDYGN